MTVTLRPYGSRTEQRRRPDAGNSPTRSSSNFPRETP